MINDIDANLTAVLIGVLGLGIVVMSLTPLT